jgi:hypothetical protein
MTPQATHALTTAAIIALIAWRLYARIRRNIGRQRLSPVRPWITLVLFPTLIVFLGLATRMALIKEEALLGGIVLGIALGVLGHRLTKFEVTPEGLFYIPSAHLGILLSTVFVCRIAYRFLVNGIPDGGGFGGRQPITPLTLVIFGTLAGYYCTYAVGLLRWSFSTRRAQRESTQPTDSPQRS